MPINIATITPASLKAKEVATEDYVDTAVSNATISDATWQTKVQQALDSNTTTIDGAKIATGSIAADKIAANSITANQIAANTITADRINVESLNAGNIVAKNVIVPGANNGLPVFSADSNRVLISNLKVLGTASMPGLAKSGMFDIPSRVPGVNGAYTTVLSAYVYKPYECDSWGAIIVVGMTHGSFFDDSPDTLAVKVYINGSFIAQGVSVSPYANNVVVTCGIGGVRAGSFYVEVTAGGMHNGGYLYGNLSYVSTVED